MAGEVTRLPLIELLHAASREASYVFEQELRDAGVNGSITARQAMAIIALAKNAHINQQSLVNLTGMDRSSLSVMVRRMEDLRLIVRTVDEKDNRAMRLDLTPKSRRYLQAIQEAEAATMVVLTERIGKGQISLIETHLQRFITREIHKKVAPE